MFKLIDKGFSDVIKCDFELYEHTILKTKHFHFKALSDESIFLIGYNTPTNNDKGIAHALEHLVFLGSKNYTEYDITQNLNSKVNISINARTKFDNTFYFFETSSLKQFYTQVDMFCDMTLFPKINQREFNQEIVRFEYNDDNEISANGVVYNEMLGCTPSYPNPTDQIYLNKGYSGPYISGGNPVEMLDLTSKEVKQYHTKFYHPSNATLITLSKKADIKEIHKTFNDKFKDFNYATPFTANHPKANKLSENIFKEFDINSLAPKGTTLAKSTVWQLKDCYKDDFRADIIRSCLRRLLSIENLYITSKDNMFLIEFAKTQNFEEYDKELKEALNKVKEFKVTKKQLVNIKEDIENYTEKYKKADNYLEFLDDFYSELVAGIDYKAYLRNDVFIETINELVDNPSILNNYLEKSIFNSCYTQYNVKSNGDDISYFDILENKINNISSTFTENKKEQLVKDLKEIEDKYFSFKPMDFASDDSAEDFRSAKKGYNTKTTKIIKHKGKKVTSLIDNTSQNLRVTRYTHLANITLEELPLISIYKTLLSKTFINEFTQHQRKQIENFEINIHHTENNKGKSRIALNKILEFKADKIDKALTLITKFDEFDFNKHKKLIKNIIANELDAITKLDDFEGYLLYNISKAKTNVDYEYVQHIDGINAYQRYIELKSEISTPKKLTLLIEQLNVIHKKVIKSLNKSELLYRVPNEKYITILLEKTFDETVVSTKSIPKLNYKLEKSDIVGVIGDISSNSCEYIINMPKHNISEAHFNVINAITKEFINQNFVKNYLRNITGAYSYNFYIDERYNTAYMSASRVNNISKTHEAFKQLKPWLENPENCNLEYFERQLKIIKKMFKQNKYRSKLLKEISADKIVWFIQEILLKSLDNAIFTGVFNKDQYRKENLNLPVVEIKERKINV